MITPLRTLSKGLNLLHDFLLNPKFSSHWYERDINRRSGQPSCTFLSRRSSKRKMTSPLKVSGIMINGKAITIDSVILFFPEFISMVENNRFL